MTGFEEKKKKNPIIYPSKVRTKKDRAIFWICMELRISIKQEKKLSQWGPNSNLWVKISLPFFPLRTQWTVVWVTDLHVCTVISLLSPCEWSTSDHYDFLVQCRSWGGVHPTSTTPCSVPSCCHHCITVEGKALLLRSSLLISQSSNNLIWETQETGWVKQTAWCFRVNKYNDLIKMAEHC